MRKSVEPNIAAPMTPSSAPLPDDPLSGGAVLTFCVGWLAIMFIAVAAAIIVSRQMIDQEPVKVVYQVLTVPVPKAEPKGTGL